MPYINMSVLWKRGKTTGGVLGNGLIFSSVLSYIFFLVLLLMVISHLTNAKNVESSPPPTQTNAKRVLDVKPYLSETKQWCNILAWLTSDNAFRRSGYSYCVFAANLPLSMVT